MRQKYCNSVFMLVALLSLLLAACQFRGYLDGRATVNATRLNLPAAQYTDAAWLNADEIALAYKQPEDWQGTTRIALFNLRTGRLEDIILPSHPDGCLPDPSGVYGLSRLSNSNLAYIYFCFGDLNGYSGELREWDRENRTITTLVRYPEFGPGPYSVSPDMSEVLQENPVGAILNNEPYLFQTGGEGMRILTDFKRAGSPSWAPDGESLIFAGTKSTAFDSSETFADVEGLARSPWSIYKMNADQTQLQELLSGLNRPFLAWSPDVNRIGFAATYRNKSGTWLYDVNTGEVELIWDGASQFSWSPDGTSLVVLDRDEDSDLFVYNTYPTILTLNDID